MPVSAILGCLRPGFGPVAHAGRSRRARVLAITTIVLLAGCARVHRVPIPEETRVAPAESTATAPGVGDHDAFHSRRGQEIRAYVTRDSVRHAFHGYARVLGDSVRFETIQEHEWGVRSAPPTVIQLPREELLSVEAMKIDPVGTVVMSIMVLAVLGLIIAASQVGGAAV